jgi:polar amino acid transport system permease protein
MSAQRGYSASPPISASPDVRLVPAGSAATHGTPVPVVRPARRYGAVSVAGAIAVVTAGALILWSAITDKAFEWPIFAFYFFAAPVLAGVGMTLVLTFFAGLVAVVLGTILAVMRMTSNPILIAASTSYAWFFRGIPVLVQLIFWYNLALLFPSISLGFPGIGWLFAVPTNLVVTPFTAAILGLGLSMAAYMGEVVRGGIISVGAGQIEAIRSLGMTHEQGLRRIILPQAMRVVLPPVGNELIGLLKWTSLASVISVTELMEQTNLISSRNFHVIPLLMVAALWYLAVTTIFSVVQGWLERHFGKGA